MAPLFAPFHARGLALANRIVMAPMTRAHSPGGVPGADVAAYYRRRAENGVGLIITEGTSIDHPAASSNPAVPRFHGESSCAPRRSSRRSWRRSSRRAWTCSTARRGGSSSRSSREVR